MAGIDGKGASISKEFSLGKETGFADVEDSPKRDQRGGLRSRGKKKWWQTGGQDVVFVPVRDDEIVANKGSHGADHDEVADGSVFTDPRTENIYAPIAKYEGAHRFDPKATWSEAEERALVRRVSILPLLWLGIPSVKQ